MEENDVMDVETVATTEETTNTPEETSEPSSMLEAIQDGLKGESTEVTPEEENTPEEVKEPEVKPEEVSPENDEEPPEGISKKAQERFRNLTHRLKEKDAEIASVRSDLEGIREVMKSTGASAEDFGNMFDYMTALNKGDMARVQSILEAQVRQFTVMTGKQLNVDPLSEFPDIRQRVDSYQMDEQTAFELARQRTFQQNQQRTQQAQQAQQQNQQQVQHLRQQAIAQVDQLGAEWAKKDPDYKLKEEIILKQIPEIARQFHPSQWVSQVKILYQTLSSMPMQKPVNPVPPPLRSSGQTAGAKQPGSMLEALKSGLGYSA